MTNGFIVMNIRKRIRTNPSIISYGLYLYFNSTSYRLAAKSLEPIIKRIHISIWKRVQNIQYWQVDRFVIIEKRKVEKIFVDETLLKIDGQNYCWLWLAYEPSLHV
jgi:transposase-like protein